MQVQLIADSGATKCDWKLIGIPKPKKFTTQGISPYFLPPEAIATLLHNEVIPRLKGTQVDAVHFYGTGLSHPANQKILQRVLRKQFPKAELEVATDIVGAARALCGREKGIACILGTGSNSCYYNGKKIVRNSPGIGYILGDEGSGAYLGKKLVQYYLYDIMEEPLRTAFEQRFHQQRADIMESVYKKPLANRYLASLAIFLAENRGHYMVENILEDGLRDFFHQHLFSFREIRSVPIHFTGSIAFGFKDVLLELCKFYELKAGKIIKTPLQGLIDYHS